MIGRWCWLRFVLSRRVHLLSWVDPDFTMSSFLVKWLFELLSRFPLRGLHFFGSVLGWLTYWSSASYAARLRENLGYYNAGRHPDELGHLLSANIAETGKSIAELPWVWRRPLPVVLGSVKQIYGLEYFQAFSLGKQGLVILTPHLGCFEIIGMYVAHAMPMTCMYTVPKRAWMDEVIRSGRQRGQMKLAPADLGGVRMMLKALKRGEAIGLLPDQVPSHGEGEWEDFFGRPAYTMTLAGRLLEVSGARVLLSYVVRRSHGDGYDLYFSPLDIQDGVPVTRQINQALEKIIRMHPEQYLWSYNRYKAPAGSMPPPDARESA